VSSRWIASLYISLTFTSFIVSLPQLAAIFFWIVLALWLAIKVMKSRKWEQGATPVTQ
jgi:hypothetical protein